MTLVSGESPEGCCQVLLLEYQNLLMQKMALDQELSQLAESNRPKLDSHARADIQRRVGPAFYRLNELARTGNWKELYSSLAEGLDKLAHSI